MWFVQQITNTETTFLSNYHKLEIFDKTRTKSIVICLKNKQDHGLLFELLKPVSLVYRSSLNEDFKFLKKIGQGQQARVGLYYKKDSEFSEDNYAIKSYKLDSLRNFSIPLFIKNEITFLRDLSICENITHLESVYIANNEIHLVMKFAKDGSLLSYLSDPSKKFSEEQIRTIMVQLLLTLDLMHSKGIYHRDIKPDNILLYDKERLQVCIADLGLACRKDDNQSLILKVGTPTYVAPEVLAGQPFNNKSDIFSLGSFLFNLLTGTTLFKGTNFRELLHQNQYSNPIKIIDDSNLQISDPLKEVLKKMLAQDPAQRVTIEECLNLQWFQQDREALKDSLIINRNMEFLTKYNLQNNDYSINSNNNSFCLAPQYFLDLLIKAESSVILKFKKDSENQSQFPSFKIQEGSVRKQLSVCYNHILSESRSKTPSVDFKNHKNLIFDFKMHLQTQNQPKPVPDLNFSLMNIKDNDFDCKDEELEAEEYSARFDNKINDVASRFINRHQIYDKIDQEERRLHIRNKRN